MRFVAIYRIYLFVTDLIESQKPFKYLAELGLMLLDCENCLCENVSANDNLCFVTLSSIYITSPCGVAPEILFT